MRNRIPSLLLACFAIGSVAPKAASQAQAAPTVARIVDREISTAEEDIVAAAEAMPEDKYDFSPASLSIKGSDYDGVRTFAGEVKHLATANYVFWSALVGETPPAGIASINGPESLKTKAEIVKFLKDSFALGHRAAQTLTSDNILEIVPLPAIQKKVPRLYAATFVIAHSRDHYGQMAEYLRMNGIVPPASRGN